MSTSDRLQLDAQHTSRLRALGAWERPVYEWHAQLVAVVRSGLGEQDASFFAEPVYDSSSGRIDWYAPLNGEAVRLDALDEEAHAAAETRIAALLERLRGLQAQLAADDTAETRRRAEILRVALSFPDKGQVYLVGEQPVVVNWGFVEEGRDAPFMPLFRSGAPLQRRSVLGGSGARLAFPWWLWPLLLLLLGALALSYCGDGRLSGPFLPPGTPGGVDPGVPLVAGDDAAALRARLAKLRVEYAARLAACEPLAQADPRKPRRAGPGGRSWIDRRTGERVLPGDVTDLAELPPELQERLRDPQTGELPTLEDLLADPNLMLAEDWLEPGELGDPNLGGLGPDLAALDPEGFDPLLDPPPDPLGEPDPVEPPAPGEAPSEPGAEPPSEPPGEPLALPDDLKPGQSPDFFAGRWRSETPLAERSMTPGESVAMTYEFDEKGEGRIALKHTDGTSCSARARASVRDAGKLHIEALEKARCSDGESYGKLQVDCQQGGADGVKCEADQGNGRKFPVDLRR